MISKPHQLNTGFTLIETIIYLALLSIIVLGGLLTSYELLESGRHNAEAIAIQEEEMFISRKIDWALDGAEEVLVIPSNTLTIFRPDIGSQSPIVVSNENSMMMFKRGGYDALPLNSERFPVTNVYFSMTPAENGHTTSTEVTFMVGGKGFVFKKYMRP